MTTLDNPSARAELTIVYGGGTGRPGRRGADLADALRGAGRGDLVGGPGGVRPESTDADEVAVKAVCRFCGRRLADMWGTAAGGARMIGRFYLIPIGLPVELRAPGDDPARPVPDRFRIRTVCSPKCGDRSGTRDDGHRRGRGVPVRGEHLDAAFRRAAGRGGQVTVPPDAAPPIAQHWHIRGTTQVSPGGNRG